MTHYAERTMPVVTAYQNGSGWLVALPGGIEVQAEDEEAVRAVVARQAPGSAVLLTDEPAITESEYRLLDGNR